jgi:hypothetical protein
MKVTFKDEALYELYTEDKTDSKKYKKICKDKKLLKGYQRAVGLMFHISTVDRLKEFSFLHYERLKYKSMSSVRIMNGRVERLLFTESEDGIEIELIEIDSTHYGNQK